MKKGDPVRCPRCGEDSVVKTSVVMHGWSKAGEVFCCTLCGGELGKVEPASAAGETRAADAVKLSALLGEELDRGNKLQRRADDGAFCSNCRHFVVHPFQSRCGRHGRTTDPMGDCPDFARKGEG